jgi:CRP/FNR family transcriptional regulator, cyclic AMP receptor protein
MLSSLMVASIVLGSILRAWVVPAVLFVLVVVAGYVAVRWFNSQQVAAVRFVPLFSGMSTRQLRSVVATADEVEFPPGATIIEEGDQGRSFYLIKEGSAALTAPGAEPTVLGPGAYVGEISLLDGGPRTATVRAETAVRVLELTPSGFDRLLGKDPSVGRIMMRNMTTWLRDAGGMADDAAGGTDGDRSRLAELGERLRAARRADWGQPKDPGGSGARTTG